MGFTYKSYNFVEKDPIIDEVRTIYQESGANYVWIHEHSGVSTGTLNNWFSGQTKRPQAATVNAVLRSLGYKLGVVADAEAARVQIVPAMPQPQRRQPSKPVPKTVSRHVLQMSKYKRNRGQ